MREQCKDKPGSKPLMQLRARQVGKTFVQKQFKDRDVYWPISIMKVPVILLNYNSCADCCKCVTDLKQQEGVELEIIIVDNCSRTEDALAVEKLAAEQGCTFIAAAENRGYNAGNNIGLRYTIEILKNYIVDSYVEIPCNLNDLYKYG